MLQLNQQATTGKFVGNCRPLRMRFQICICSAKQSVPQGGFIEMNMPKVISKHPFSHI